MLRLLTILLLSEGMLEQKRNVRTWPFSPLLSCRGRTLKTSASLGSGHPVNSFYSIKKKTFCYPRCKLDLIEKR
jgi:hypothetical protein